MDPIWYRNATGSRVGASGSGLSGWKVVVVSGPLHAVLGAFEDGATSLAEVCKRTGLARETVDGAVEHLRRMGRLDSRELAMGCPAGGCGSCAWGKADGESACGATGPSNQRRGLVLVQLSLRTARSGNRAVSDSARESAACEC